ncbi:hypothetical protein Sj15T_10600 [Sphingobium sp. TA15]|uniref:Uncharacterized protein n=1 Tax=Sphingobium indicum (strain DSM 16413 / CCM 7287 / MTCC 6362 / UT26 / NBRC 101211 / UT26S) TaxID=452662 RepID=D4Z8X9_SPHIU|nr:hypothetical protein [Sphingobium indicum]BAI99061.1 hypothetical protein SJA_P1-01090 [Sphingobium indicum UT26S]BDD66039.1 hypothetical protein Sj15T_10600 [Sphingobium sp. TA15]
MLKRKPNLDQFAFDLSKDAALERMIEARVAIRCENDAIRWRFRLILIETCMIASLVLVAGLALKQPTALVIRGSLIVGAGCFASGVMLIGLSGLTGHLLSIYRRWRQR